MVKVFPFALASAVTVGYADTAYVATPPEAEVPLIVTAVVFKT
jgi:hypothetical protein